MRELFRRVLDAVMGAERNGPEQERIIYHIGRPEGRSGIPNFL
jgi:hypothetical protein